MLKLLKKKADPKVGPDYLVLNIGPQHPSAARDLRIVVQLDGEHVERCVPQNGYLHGGFEKLAESMPTGAFFELLDRGGSLASATVQLALVEAIETLADIETTERCAYVRVLIAELDRIARHLRTIAAIAHETGADLASRMLREPAAQVDALVARFFGGRTFARIGGLAADIPAGVTTDCDETLDGVERALASTESMLSRNRIFVHRTKGIGTISRDDARAHTLSGPTLRATGIAEDVRRTAPYLVYDRIDFDIPVGTRGDTFDRYLVRCAEIRESRKIIHEVLNALPLGKVGGDAKPADIELPTGELYRAIESPDGELGVYLAAAGGSTLRRLRLRSPSLAHFEAFGAKTPGHELGNVLPFLASLGIRPAEIDR